jgi:hypothetical protein
VWQKCSFHIPGQVNFLDLIEALQEQFRDERADLIWIDVVSLNQHEKIKMKVDWLTGTLRNWIKDFNRTVMALAPWNDPVPLTRGWCIWEIYCSIDTGADSQVAMTFIVSSSLCFLFAHASMMNHVLYSSRSYTSRLTTFFSLK